MSQHTCLLCYQQIKIIGLLPCNHKYICQMCTMKLTNDKIYYTCPICKISSKTILFSNVLDEDFDVLIKSKTIERCSVKDKQGFLYLNSTVKNLVDKENYFICYFQTCFYEFSSLNLLKKHLNEFHKKQFCDLCLMYKKCLLSQQIMYSETQLNSHLNDGQFEETGIINLYHPYCEFCRIRYYDEQSFLKHMKSHEQCFLCQKKPAYKFIYYKDYPNLQMHFDRSHFLCKLGNCLEKKFMNVFATQELKDFHYSEVHLGQQFSNKTKKKIEKIECNELTGFNSNQPQIILKDNYGKNIEKQLVSISRKCELNQQIHADTAIDIRQFYNERCNFTKNLSVNQLIKRIHEAVECVVYEFGLHKEIDDVPLQFVDFFKPLLMKNLNKTQLSRLLDDLYPPKQSHQIKYLFFQQMNTYHEFQDFCYRLKKVLTQNNRLIYFYYVFPQFIRYFKDTAQRKKKMDDFYLRQLLDLKPKNGCIVLHQFHKYGKFIYFLKERIEQVIHKRIKEKKIDLNLYVKRLKNQKFNENDQKQFDFFVPKEKIVNLYHMIQKVKTHQLLKLNWLLKLGFSVQDLTHITKNLYLGSIETVVEQFDKLKNQQLALLYYYYKIVLESLESKQKFKFEKQKAEVNLLRQFFNKHKNACKQYQNFCKIDNKFQVKNKNQIKKVINNKIISYQDDPELPSLPSYPTNVQKNGSNNNILGFGNSSNHIKSWDENKKVEMRKKKEEKQEYDQEQSKKLSAKQKFYETISKKQPKQQNTNKQVVAAQKKKIQPQKTKKYQEKNQSVELTQDQQIRLAIQQSKIQYEQSLKREKEIQKQIQKSNKQSQIKKNNEQKKKVKPTKQLKPKQQKKQQKRQEKLKEIQQQKLKRQNQIESEQKKLLDIKMKQINQKKANKNIFEVLQVQQEEINLKKQITKKVNNFSFERDEQKKIQPKVTFKNIQKQTNHNKMINTFEEFPSLEQEIEYNSPKRNNKNKSITIKPQEQKKNQSYKNKYYQPKMEEDEEDFPNLESGQVENSLIKQVTMVNSPQIPIQQKVKKRKGKVVVYETVDIFKR